MKDIYCTSPFGQPNSRGNCMWCGRKIPSKAFLALDYLRAEIAIQYPQADVKVNNFGNYNPFIVFSYSFGKGNVKFAFSPVIIRNRSEWHSLWLKLVKAQEILDNLT